MFLVALVVGCNSSVSDHGSTANTSNIPPEILAEMPPDPGAAADATLAGVDANRNNVRDDIEIWAIENYHNDPDTMSAILACGQSLQAHFNFEETHQYIKNIRTIHLQDVYCSNLVVV